MPYHKDARSAPLSRLFTAMLRHGIVPDTLHDCILVPIPNQAKIHLLIAIVQLHLLPF